ncbi:restriction endonuclease subunit S [Nostoc sp.]|uniref:restriction endonuclease subunit S n=1 Tax=Nostoc sp. TaxID=1180 RepID=UPI002FF9EBEF
MELKTPLGWSIKQIKDIGKCVTGTTPRTNEPEYYSSFDYDFISPADLGNSKYIYNSNKKVSQKGIEVSRPIPKNTVLCVCIGSSIGKVGLSWHKKSCTNQQINSIICNKFNNPHFIYYLLLYYSDYWKSFATFSTVPILNKGRFEEITLPTCNDIEEQQKIARVLAMVQDAIVQQEQLITLTTELRKNLIHKLFSEGIVNETRKNTEIIFPESWNVKALGELASKPHGCLQTGPFGSQLHKDEYQTEGIPVINPTHLAGNKINPEDVPRISLQTASRLSRHYLEVGDILFARRGEIGRHGIVGEKENGWLCGTGCFLVRVKQRFIDNRFLSYYFSTNQLITWLYKHAAGAIMPNLNNAVMRKIPVYFPDIAIQQQIADNLDLIGGRISNLQEKHTLLNDLFRTLLHQLITAKIRVDDLNLSALNIELQGGDNNNANL